MSDRPVHFFALLDSYAGCIPPTVVFGGSGGGMYGPEGALAVSVGWKRL